MTTDLDGAMVLVIATSEFRCAQAQPKVLEVRMDADTDARPPGRRASTGLTAMLDMNVEQNSAHHELAEAKQQLFTSRSRSRTDTKGNASSPSS